MEHIRRAELPDLDAVVPLFHAYRAFFTEKPAASSRAFLEERLRLLDSVVLAAFVNGEAAGFLQLYPLFSSWYAARIWFLSDLYVAEPFRKNGTGRRLVQAAHGFARESGSSSIMVEIPRTEPHLVRFYESLQFSRDRDFDLYRCYLAD